MIDHLDSAPEIESIALTILKESKAYRKFPTPVDRIVTCADLILNKEINLYQPPKGFLKKTLEELGRVSKKILGILDFRQKTIFLDLTQKISRQNFIKLHEVGHKICPWQEATLRWDDEITISPEAREVFEKEASFFASATLFQLDLFEEEADKLPLAISSALSLSNKFGASIQATLRRYIQYSKKRCALLVLEKPKYDGIYNAYIRNYFVSDSFYQEFGNLVWPEACDLNYPFVQDALRKRKCHEEGVLSLIGLVSQTSFDYHYFDNSYNIFVLIKPPGEEIFSRTKVILTSNSI